MPTQSCGRCVRLDAIDLAAAHRTNLVARWVTQVSDVVAERWVGAWAWWVFASHAAVGHACGVKGIDFCWGLGGKTKRAAVAKAGWLAVDGGSNAKRARGCAVHVTAACTFAWRMAQRAECCVIELA